MWLNLSCYKRKIDCYIYKMNNVNFMVTTNKKPVVDIQTIKRKESKHTTTKGHHITKEDSKKGRKENEGIIKQPENNEQYGNSKSLPINNYFKCKRIKLSNQKT